MKMPCAAGFWKTCGIAGGMNSGSRGVGDEVGAEGADWTFVVTVVPVPAPNWLVENEVT